MPKRGFGKILTRALAVAALAVVAGFATLTLSDTSALARGGHGGHGVSGRAFAGGRAGFVGRPFVGRPFVGRPFVGRGRFIRGRFFWHGRWWWPGVGPCWQWTPWGWMWVCGP
jgi:hypothetical protein